MNGILFTPQNIELTISNKKSQTRRLDHLKEINQKPDEWECKGYFQGDNLAVFCPIVTPSSLCTAVIDEIQIRPRYHVGEYLYLKEAHYSFGYWEKQKEKTISGRYKVRFVRLADNVYFNNNKPTDLLTGTMGSEAICDESMWFLRSPMFMFAKDARHFIQITGVGAERLNDISGEDCMKEGITLPFRVFGDGDGEYYEGIEQAYRDAYFALWDSINGEGSNEWVWVYDYKLTKEFVDSKVV
jgi:hypothetical protein